MADKKKSDDEISHFLMGSSVHAVSQIGHSRSKYRKIFWVFVFIICLVGCTYEIHRWLKNYLEYPVLISLEVENPLTIEFPSVTVCNLNRVKSEHESCIREGMEYYKCPTTAIRTRTLIISETKKLSFIPKSKSKSKYSRKFKEELGFFLKQYSSLDEFSRKMYGYDYYDMIKRCSFGSAKCDFSNFSDFYDLQFGNCFTFNRKEHQTPLMTLRPGLDYGLEIEVNPLEDTYLNITSSVGYLVVIHDKDEDPNPAENGINISPGFETHLSLTKTSIKRLPAPYRDKCFNYNTSATEASTRGEFDCIRACIQKVSLASCSCVDPLLPALEEMEKCDIKNESSVSCLMDVIDKMTMYGLPCDCPLPCQTTWYDVRISSSLWNSDSSDKLPSLINRIDGSGNISPQRDKKSLLKVFFKNFEHKIYSQKPAFTEAELYAHMGGHLSFFLGLSLVAIFESIQYVIYFLKFLSSKYS